MKTIHDFMAICANHPDIKPLEEMTYDDCTLMVSEFLMEGSTWKEMSPYCMAINIHFGFGANLILHKN